MPTQAAELSGFSLLAHEMGMAARKRGETVADNPFQDEPDASAAWLDGWMREAGAFATLPYEQSPPPPAPAVHFTI